MLLLLLFKALSSYIINYAMDIFIDFSIFWITFLGRMQRSQIHNWWINSMNILKISVEYRLFQNPGWLLKFTYAEGNLKVSNVKAGRNQWDLVEIWKFATLCIECRLQSTYCSNDRKLNKVLLPQSISRHEAIILARNLEGKC